MANLVTTREQNAKLMSVRELLEKHRDSLAQVVPKHMTPERLIKVALSAMSRQPQLLECTNASLYKAILQSAELGLEPGGLLGEAYLVPYFRSFKDDSGQWQRVREVQLIPGYRGLIKLARQSGQLKSIEARIVRENDEFELSYGSTQQLVHRPCLRGDPGPFLLVYAIARFNDGGEQIDVMTLHEVETVRDRTRRKETVEGPWATDFAEMARKTVVRRLCKYLPLSRELAAALEADGDAEVPPPPAAPSVLEGPVLAVPTRAKALAQRLRGDNGGDAVAELPVGPTEATGDLQNVPEDPDARP
jgi:recombination protein RecT